jgi:hypothetical protein
MRWLGLLQCPLTRFAPPHPVASLLSFYCFSIH